MRRACPATQLEAAYLMQEKIANSQIVIRLATKNSHSPTARSHDNSSHLFLITFAVFVKRHRVREILAKCRRPCRHCLCISRRSLSTALKHDRDGAPVVSAITKIECHAHCDPARDLLASCRNAASPAQHLAFVQPNKTSQSPSYWQKYTGHSLRRTAATSFVQDGA